MLKTIFSTVGLLIGSKMNRTWIPSPLFRKRPRLYFSLLEALIEGAVALGLERTTAEKFALQTCKGALKLAENSDL